MCRIYDKRIDKDEKIKMINIVNNRTTNSTFKLIIQIYKKYLISESRNSFADKTIERDKYTIDTNEKV